MPARRRALALDLDGTLIDGELRLDPRDAEAIRRATERGVLVIACTGRPFPAAQPWAERLGLATPIVCYQGAEVRSPDGSMLLDRGVPHDLAMEVVRFGRERSLHVQAYRDDRLFAEHDRVEGRAYARVSGMELLVVHDLDAALGATTPSLLIIANQSEVEALLPEARERWRDSLFVTTSLPDFLDFTSPDATKRLALEFVASRLGFTADETVAVGDGRNDRPMLEWAGLAVAIEGSPADLLEVADLTIAPPGRGGIASLIDEMFD